MTNLELFTALGGISPENLSGAEELQNKPCVHTNRKMRVKRTVLIAAVIALTLLLVGCAVPGNYAALISVVLWILLPALLRAVSGKS